MLRVGFDVILTVTDGNVAARVCVMFPGIFPGDCFDLISEWEGYVGWKWYLILRFFGPF